MIDKILEDREKRYNKILGLLKNGAKSVICGKINYPGEQKNTPESLKAFDCLLEILKGGIITDEKYEILEGFDGKSVIAGTDVDCRKLKLEAFEIEESHPLGRIFDIDVYAGDGIPTGRREIGLPERKCIVCGGNAKLCVRTKKHSYYDTIKIFNKIINDYEGKNGEF